MFLVRIFVIYYFLLHAFFTHYPDLPQGLRWSFLGQILIKRNIRYWLNASLFNFDTHKGLTVKIYIILVCTQQQWALSFLCMRQRRTKYKVKGQSVSINEEAFFQKHSRRAHVSPIFPVSHTGNIFSSVIFFLWRCKSCLRYTAGDFNENASKLEHSSNFCEQFEQRPNVASTFKLNVTCDQACGYFFSERRKKIRLIHLFNQPLTAP